MFDLSGAFDSRAPFDQYWYLYTAYDGLNIGIKNRLPLAAVIQGIYSLLQQFLGLHPGDVAKIALLLLFTGAFSSFFWLLPRWIRLFAHTDHMRIVQSGGWQLLRTVLSLLYLFIPAFTYHIAHWHLFFLSIFYPLQIYFFIRVLEEKRFRWHMIAALILTLFWGLTSPHAIAFTGITFVILFVGFTLRNIFIHPRKVAQGVVRLCAAAGGTFITQLYWIIPYFLLSSPAPGYVINRQMIELLSRFSTLPHFLQGDAEWYLDQGQLSIFSTDSGLATVQWMGLALFLIIAFGALVKYIRNTYVASLVILFLVVGLLATQGNPVYDWFYDVGVYSSYGWVLREPNRIFFIWNYWIFLLFCIGTIWVTTTLVRSWRSLNSWINGLVITSLFIFYCAYSLPTAMQFLSYTKPEELPSEVQEVFTLLNNDSDNFYVHWYPEEGAYRLPWRAERFQLSDSLEYNFFPYIAQHPPTKYSGSVPNAKSIPDLMMDYAISNRDSTDNFNNLATITGVKYIVIYRNPPSYWFSSEDVQKGTINPLLKYLEGISTFSEVVTNDHFIVFKNNQFVNRTVLATEKNILLADDLKVLSKADTHSLLSNDWKPILHPEEWATITKPVQNQSIAIFSDNTNYFLDLLTDSDRQKYTLYPYDHIKNYGLNVDWGRGSPLDRVNGEMTPIFRRYGINSWSFDQADKMVYSDQPVDSSRVIAQSTFTSPVACTTNCAVYVKILQNHLAGSLTLLIDNESFSLQPKDDFEVYRWVRLTDNFKPSSKQIRITMTNQGGFTSIGGILILPQTLLNQYKDVIEKQNTIYRIPTTANNVSVAIPNSNVLCNWSTTARQNTILPSLSLRGECLRNGQASLPAYNGYLITQNNTQRSLNYSRLIPVNQGANNLTVYLFSHYDLIMWGLFIIDAFYILLLTFIAFRFREPKHSKLAS